MSVVAYGWWLRPNSEDLRARGEHPFELLHEFHRYPYDVYAQAAEKVQADAIAAVNERRWFDACEKYRQFASLFDRFRSPDILAVASAGLIRTAKYALRNGNAGLSLRALDQYFLIGELTADAIDLKRAAKNLDARSVARMEEMATRQIRQDEVSFAVQQAVDYPQQFRLALAEQITNRVIKEVEDESTLLLDRANLYMAQGKWREALDLLAPASVTNPRVQFHMQQWQNFMIFSSDREGLRFGPIPKDDEIEHIVNRGFAFFANGFYEDALQSFLFAISRNESDPFALFGHALCLWQAGMFSLAANRLTTTIARIEDYPDQPRFLQFLRNDTTCPPRSYGFNPRYLIFNPAECLERVARIQPFLSHFVLP